MKSRTGIIVALLGLGSALVGCSEKESETCGYWSKKLTSPSKMKMALEKVAKLKCTDALPTLEALFEEGTFRNEILIAASRIGDGTTANGIVVKALLDPDTATRAAELAKDWRVKEATPILREIVTGKPANMEDKERKKQLRSLKKVKGNALEALLKVAKGEELEGLLIELAGAPVGAQGIKVNRIAIEQLGEMRSEKAIPTLIRAAFVETEEGQLYGQVRLALSRVGAPVVPHLIKAMQGKDEELMKWAAEQDVSEWRVSGAGECRVCAQRCTPETANRADCAKLTELETKLAAIPPMAVLDEIKTAEERIPKKQERALLERDIKALKEEQRCDWCAAGQKLTQLLMDTMDPRIAAPAVANLAQDFKAMGPPNMTDSESAMWRASQFNRFQFLRWGLAHVDASGQVEALAKMLADDTLDSDRLNYAAHVLSGIGTKEAQETLLAWFSKQSLTTSDRELASMLLDSVGTAVGPETVGAFDTLWKQRLAEETAFIAEKKLKDVKKLPYLNRRAKDERLLANLAVVSACKSDADCLITRLNSGKHWEVLKAAYLLARDGMGDGAKVRAGLIQAYREVANAGLDAGEAHTRRTVLIMALARRADDKTGFEMLKLAELHEPPKSAQDAFWRSELQTRGNYLSRRAPAK